MGLILNIFVCLLIVQVYSDTIPVSVPGFPQIVVKNEEKAVEVEGEHHEGHDHRSVSDQFENFEKTPELPKFEEKAEMEFLRLVPVPGRWGVYKTPNNDLVRVIEAMEPPMNKKCQSQRDLSIDEFWRLMMGGRPGAEPEKDHPAGDKGHEGKPIAKPIGKPVGKPEEKLKPFEKPKGREIPSKFNYPPYFEMARKTAQPGGGREARFWPFSSWWGYDDPYYGGYGDGGYGGYGDSYDDDDLGGADEGYGGGYGGYGGYGGGGYGGYYRRRSVQ